MIFSGKNRFICNTKRSFGILILISFALLILMSIRPIPVLAQENSSQTGKELHAFYPAYAVFSDQLQKYIDEVDSISFAWSRIDAKEPGVLNTVKGNNGNTSFYYPSDYIKPVSYAKSAGKTIQLSVYMSSSDCIKLLPDGDKRSQMIKAITDALQKDITQGENIYFDGVVIDFEGLRDTDGSKNPILYDGISISTYFNQFLTELKKELTPLSKKLYVAVNPRLYYDGYDYSGILKTADRVILMAHDYETAQKLQKNQVQQYTGFNSLKPVNSMAPIVMVRQALNDIKNSASDKSELSKVWLQICFDSAQWKYSVNGAEGWNDLDALSLSKEGRVTPLYKSIKARADNTDGNAEDMSYGYNNELQTPYIQYYNDSDKTWNIILYEDSNSITAKIEQAKAFGLGGISIWSLSNVPDYNDAVGRKYHLDGWSTIIKKMKSFTTPSAAGKINISFTDKAVEQAVREKLGKLSGSITKADTMEIYRLKLPNGVKSLNDLKKLTNLEYLDASNLGIKDISAVESLKNLRVLYLQRNEISNIKPLKKLYHLEILSLNGNRLASVASLSTLTNLQELYLLENRIEDISALSKLKKLSTLEIGTNQIKNLNSIINLKNLRNLDLSNNKITDIRYLKQLTKLKQLYLQRNSISTIQSLAGLDQLKELSLNGNRISELKPLAKLTSLEKLYLKDNQITKVTSLKTLNNLRELYLSGNRISDYSPLKNIYNNFGENCDFALK